MGRRDRKQYILLSALVVLLVVKYCEARCESSSVVNGKSRCVVDCKWGNKVCECETGYEECQFFLEIDEFYSFTSYEILTNGDVQVRGTHGVIHSINSTGHTVPISTSAKCSSFENNPNYNCSIPNWTDGNTFKVITGVNGVFPAPSLIVDEASTVIAYVKNNLTQEGTSIHWHGMRQFNTPWMDGVPSVTQCPIGPSSIFRYIFKAEPSGTFWYHSHAGVQRAVGIFGSLIVRENSQKMEQVNSILWTQFGIGTYSDKPDIHTIVASDWNDKSDVGEFLNLNAILGSYADVPLGVVPVPGDTPYAPRSSYDNADASFFEFHSALINGLGRHRSVPFIQSRLSEFHVEYGNTYRFRIIGAQTQVLFRFSIDSHPFTVIATDGNFIEPIHNVSYLIVHSGERYDFLLTADQASGNYIMRWETTDVNITEGLPPYEHLGEGTHAILRYNVPIGDEGIPSSEYEAIYSSSPQKTCDSDTPCKVVNCPFENFHASYYTDCVGVSDLRLLIETPSDQVPSGSYGKQIFLNFNFEANSITSSINGKKFVFPPAPILTQPQDFEEQALKCDTSANCNPSELHCWCTHVVEVGYNEVLQLVISSVGLVKTPHPFHLHGNQFHVLRTGYPTYDETTGFLTSDNSDIHCPDRTCTEPNCFPPHCTQPSWSTGYNASVVIDGKTVKKDTAIVPSGGYIVVRIITDNPGAWFLHCHILPHLVEGMAMILNVAPEYHNPPPEGFGKCGNFKFSTEDFYEKLQFEPSGGDQLTSSSLVLLAFTLFLFF